MNNLAMISVTAPPETVIKKLSKANIALYTLKKKGATTTFFVKGKTIQKVFAIFTHPCYNVCVVKYGALYSAAVRALSRAGLCVGCALFAAAVALAQCMVFKIEVVGSGSYLSSQIVSLLNDQGVGEGRFYRGLDKRVFIADVMALPLVTFCSVEKRGTSLIVDVECSQGGVSASVYTPLYSPVSGEITAIVAVCGTPCFAVGDYVSVGDELISPRYTLPDGTSSDCLCVGYVSIRVSASVTSAAEEESQTALSAALAAVNLYSQEAEIISYSVRQSSQGVMYTVDFTYIHTVSINMQ